MASASEKGKMVGRAGKVLLITTSLIIPYWFRLYIAPWYPLDHEPVAFLTYVQGLVVLYFIMVITATIYIALKGIFKYIKGE